MTSTTSPLTGYRNPGFQGSGITDPIEVATFEREDLGNEDIQDTLHDKKLIESRSFCAVLRYLEGMMGKGYTACVWVCPSVDDIIENYSYDEPLQTVDRYTFTDYIVISNLGSDGLLVLYRAGTATAETIDIRVMKLSDINIEFQDMTFGPEGERDVREIMTAIKKGEPVPPILVSEKGFLQDGRHRFEAYRRLGYGTLTVEIGYHPAAKVQGQS